MDIQIQENFPITLYFTDSSGNPKSGEGVRTKVFNLNNDSIILDNVIMAEVGISTGLYKTNVTNNFTAKTQLLITIAVNSSGSKWPIVASYYQTINDSRLHIENTVDPSDGRAI